MVVPKIGVKPPGNWVRKVNRAPPTVLVYGSLVKMSVRVFGLR